MESVQDLLNALNQIEDKTLPIRLELKHIVDSGDYENYWLSDIAVRDTGMSGYEVEGEVVLYDSR